MDPISQGALGAVASQNVATRRQLAIATALGVCAGMAPDLDIFINSATDPLLFLEYHRQFTHSLIFIPIGGLICALVCHLLVRRWGLKFTQTFKYCTAGYATHALLDACTSYGTQLFWPFSHQRVAWSNISIVDPLFTIPIVVLILFAAIKKRRWLARLAAIWVVLYLGFGWLQKERAEAAGWDLAHSRGHTPVRVEAKPGFANLFLWKVIYEAQDRFYVDGVRTGLAIQIYAGESMLKLDVARQFPWLNPDSQQALDIERFRWFSGGFVSVHPSNPNRIIDVRYSMLPNEIEPLWMIELDPNAAADQHIQYAHEHTNTDSAVEKLIAMLLGKDLQTL